MALDVKGRNFCKVMHVENGRATTRRIHTMVVQAADGRVHHLSGKSLPDSISVYSGVPYSGAHVAEVLLSPRSARAVPLLPEPFGWITKRDAFFLVLGMFAYRLIAILADDTVRALTF